MAAHSTLSRSRGNLRDRVESGEGIRRCADHDERRSRAHGRDHGFDRNHPRFRVDRHQRELQIEIVRRLVKCGVRGHRCDQARPTKPAGGTPVVARGLDSEQAAFRSAGGDCTHHRLGAGRLGAGRLGAGRLGARFWLPVQDAAGKADELPFHHCYRGERGGVQTVHRLHRPHRGGGQLIDLGHAGVVHVREHTATVGGRIRSPQLVKAF